MNQRLKEHINPNKFIYIITLLSAIFGFGILLYGFVDKLVKKHTGR